MALLYYIIVCIFVYVYLQLSTCHKLLSIYFTFRKFMIACNSPLYYGERQRRKKIPWPCWHCLSTYTQKSTQSRLLFPKHTYLKFWGTVANWKWFNLDLGSIYFDMVPCTPCSTSNLIRWDGCRFLVTILIRNSYFSPSQMDRYALAFFKASFSLQTEFDVASSGQIVSQIGSRCTFEGSMAYICRYCWVCVAEELRLYIQSTLPAEMSLPLDSQLEWSLPKQFA